MDAKMGHSIKHNSDVKVERDVGARGRVWSATWECIESFGNDGIGNKGMPGRR